MKSYIGAKIVQAEPMTRDAFYSKFRNVEPNHNGEDLPGYHVRYEDGYDSWSPADVFERSYRELIPSEKALVI
jgi:hypothetical protein